MSAILTTNELPLYLQDGGKAEINTRKKELDAYLSLLKSFPREMLERTFIAINPHALRPEEVGEKEADAIKKWWEDGATKQQFCIWMDTNDHKINGKYGNWSCGFLGSRWADCDINGRRCRLAFYTRKNNPTSLQNIEEVFGKKYDYAITIDPTN